MKAPGADTTRPGRGLRSLGYELAAFGKVAHANDGPRHGFDALDRRYDGETLSRFLDRRDASIPLALFVGTNEPHVPWAAEPAYDPSTVADLRGRLEDWMSAQGDTRRLFDAPIPLDSDGRPADPAPTGRMP